LQVLKKDVDSHTPGEQFFPCEVKVWWEGEGTPKQLAYKFTIDGSKKEDSNFLTVTSPAICFSEFNQ
jgi:hypothetical protein